jgi:hypothetical protein
MKANEGLNILAMHADAEQRHNAQLVEMIALAVAVKLAAPRAGETAVVEIGTKDINEATTGFVYLAEYDEHGTMTLRIRAIEEEKIAPK